MSANTNTRHAHSRQRAMKSKPRVNAVKHRLSDAKWRRTINNCFNALNTIVAPNGRITKSGKSTSLSRIDILRTTQTYIKNAETELNRLLSSKPLKISDQSNTFCDNMQDLKQLFNRFECNYLSDDIEDSNTKNETQSDFVNTNIISDNKLDTNTNYSDNSGNSNANKIISYYNEMTNEWSNYVDLNACHHYYYQTYSVQIDERQHAPPIFNYLISKAEPKQYLLNSNIENNSSVTNVEEYCETVLLDQLSSTGSHFADHNTHQICCFPLTPKNRKLRRNDPMNRKLPVKPIRYAPESRPTKCRKKLNMDETDNNQWPGLMNLVIHSGGGDQSDSNRVKQESRTYDSDKTNIDFPRLSKDLEDIKITELCADKSQIEECLLSLDSKEDFMFGHNLTLNSTDTNISTDCDKKAVDVMINTEIEEKEILDFINSEGKYGLFGAITHNQFNENSSTSDSSNCVSHGISTAVCGETNNDSLNQFDLNLCDLDPNSNDSDADNEYGWSISDSFTEAILDDNTQFEDLTKQHFN